MNELTRASRRPKPHRLRIIGIAALLIAILLAAFGIYSRSHRDSDLRAQADADAVPTVSIVTPSRDVAAQQLVLPGQVQAYYDAPIYARVSGYLKKWNVDIGARVKSGDVLAEIETPELDQQLRQAQADLATAVAKERLAQTTDERWHNMLASTSVSKQEADEKHGDYEAKQAAVAAERANVDRLQALSGFKRITAPFDGTVTQRRTDIGALINAGGSNNGNELFRVADTHKLRVYVDVPQAYAEQISVGMHAKLQLPEQAGRTHDAAVVGTANAINESSRTLLVQLEVNNADGKLIAGSYADAAFDLPAASDVLQLPVTALLFRKQGMSVATVGSGDKVLLKKIRIGRDLGTHVDIVDGLAPDDRVIDAPPDWLADGDAVHPASENPSPESVAAKTDRR